MAEQVGPDDHNGQMVPGAIAFQVFDSRWLISMAVTEAPFWAAHREISPLPAPNSNKDCPCKRCRLRCRHSNRVLKKKPGWNTSGGTSNRIPL